MNKRVYWIDYLKGIACLIVFISHFLLAFYPSSYNGDITLSHSSFDVMLAQEPFSILNNGKFCVYLFLTISAYIFSVKLLNSDDRSNDSLMLFKRYFRFVIPIFVVCFVTYLASNLNLLVNHECAQITKSWWLDALYVDKLSLYSLFAGSFFSIPFAGNSLYSTAFWMLSYSFFGVYLVYILFSIFKDKRISFFYLAIPVIWLTIDNSTYLSFALGFVIAYVDKYFDIGLFKNKFINILMIVIGVLIAFIPFDCESRFSFVRAIINNPFSNIVDTTKLLYEIGSFLIVFGMCKYNKLCKEIKEVKGLSYLGKISFSIYLVHIVLICSISSGLFILLNSLISNYNIVVLITFIVSLVLLIALASLVYELVEKRLVTIFNKLIKVK